VVAVACDDDEGVEEAAVAVACVDVAEGGVVLVPVAVDWIALEIPLPVPEEFVPDEARELTVARVRGPKNPVAGRSCAAWNRRSAWYV